MDQIKKHAENQEKIGTSWRKALEKARENIHKKHKDKKTEVKDQIIKLLAEEKNTLEQLNKFEKERTADVIKQWTDSLQKSGTGGSDENLKKAEETKNRELNIIWTDTLHEFDTILDRQKDKLRRVEESLRNPRQGSVSAHNMNALREQQNSIHDLKTNNVNEFHRNLDQLRKDMDKVCHQIEDNDRKEREELEKILTKSRVKEHEEVDNVWKKFLENFKRSQK